MSNKERIISEYITEMLLSEAFFDFHIKEKDINFLLENLLLFYKEDTLLEEGYLQKSSLHFFLSFLAFSIYCSSKKHEVNASSNSENNNLLSVDRYLPDYDNARSRSDSENSDLQVTYRDQDQQDNLNLEVMDFLGIEKLNDNQINVIQVIDDIIEEFNSNQIKQDYSPDTNSLVKLFQEMKKQQVIYNKVKDNIFLYSMLLTSIMNTNNETSKSRSEENRIKFVTEKDRVSLFYKWVVGGEIEGNQITADQIKEAKNHDDYKTYKEIDDMILKVTKKRLKHKGYYMWLGSDIASDFADMEEKFKEYYCGATAASVYWKAFGKKLKISPRDYMSTFKALKSGKVKKYVVFNYKDWQGLEDKKLVNLVKSSLVRPGMTVLEHGDSDSIPSHFGIIIKYNSESKTVWTYEGNTSDPSNKLGESGITIRERSLEEISVLIAPPPLFSQKSISGLKKLSKFIKTNINLISMNN